MKPQNVNAHLGWLSVLLGSLVSGACQPIQPAAIVPEVATAVERLEGVQIAGLHSGIGLVKKVVLAGVYPLPISIGLPYPHTAFRKTICRKTFPQQLAFFGGENESRLARSDTRCSFSQFFAALSPQGKAVTYQPTADGEDISQDGNAQGHIHWPSWVWWIGWHWYHWLIFSLMCFFTGAGLHSFWRLLTGKS